MGDRSYLTPELFPAHDPRLNKDSKLSVPESEVYTTVGGFLMTEAGHVLKSGETVKYNGLLFQVDRVEKRRVMRVQLEIVKEDEAANAANT